ncbi:MAG: polysaccharide deacetylase family protein [Solirubrobacteraceae bacterium]
MSRSRRERAAALLNTPVLRATIERLGRWRGVLVLNYHRIGSSTGQPWDRTLWSASAEELDGQLHTLARHAEVIEPDQLSKTMNGKPGRRVLITFDDGYRDNYEIAFPLLREHGLRATFFLTTGFLDEPRAAWWDEIAWMACNAEDKPSGGQAMADDEVMPAGEAMPYGGELLPAGLSLTGGDRSASIAALVARYKTLGDGEGEHFLEALAQKSGCGRCRTSDARALWMTWAMAREMQSAGMSIGGHTVTHPVLARLSPERQRDEIAACARRLHEELKVTMRWFAYPVGGHDTFTAVTQAILRDCGVELAFSFYGDYAKPSRWEPLDVPRIHVGPGFTPTLLRATVLLPRVFARL